MNNIYDGNIYGNNNRIYTEIMHGMNTDQAASASYAKSYAKSNAAYDSTVQDTEEKDDGNATENATKNKRSPDISDDLCRIDAMDKI